MTKSLYKVFAKVYLAKPVFLLKILENYLSEGVKFLFKTYIQ